MKESLSDSNEDLYVLSTTTDIFDFTTPDTIIGAEVKSHTNRILVGLKGFFGIAKWVVFGTIGVLFEALLFGLFYFVYLKKKIIQFVAFLDTSKDALVSGLMWRRGLIFRPATHGGVMVMAAIAVVAGGLFTRGQIAAQDLTINESVIKSENTAETIVPDNRPRSEVITYKVAAGDTISAIAIKFEVSAESIKWANGMNDSDAINPEDNLKIPPISGVIHKVKEGDTLDTVSKTYQADKQTIADFPFNYIDDTLSLKVGQTLYVPNGVVPRPVSPKAPTRTVPTRQGTFVIGSGLLSWPVPANISQYFSWFHTALDLPNPYGTPIYAAASGRVIDAKTQKYGFGIYCILDIGNGYTTAYAHMSSRVCQVGQTYKKGDYIGAVGSTGRSTGPHLHFEVRRNGTAVNPMRMF